MSEAPAIADASDDVNEKLVRIGKLSARMSFLLHQAQPRMSDLRKQLERMQSGLDRANAHIDWMSKILANPGPYREDEPVEALPVELPAGLKRTFEDGDAGAIAGALISGTELELVSAMKLQTRHDALQLGKACLEKMIDQVSGWIAELADEAGGSDIGALLRETHIQRDALRREVRFGAAV